MQRVRDVIAPHRRLGLVWVAARVLLAHGGREEEREVVRRVAEQAEHVEEGEVDGEAARGLAAVVEDGLRVARGRPAEHVGPADDGGDGADGRGGTDHLVGELGGTGWRW